MSRQHLWCRQSATVVTNLRYSGEGGRSPREGAQSKMSELSGKRVVLGVSGGIAVYKAVTVASLFVQAGVRVDVVMTDAATRFVQALTFSAITHQSVHRDPFAHWHDDFSGHVSLAKDADLVVVAPATAATIARLALGMADDLIGLVVLATEAPVLLAPAMEERMFDHPATQEHLRTLVTRGRSEASPRAAAEATSRSNSGCHCGRHPRSN